MDLTLSTELDAVNTMLETIGQSPVNTLESVNGSDVSIAINTLKEVSREVQSLGWEFNTETITISPDTDSHINVPSNVIKIDPTDPTLRYVRRGTLLYDKANNTDEITSLVEAEVVWFLDFEDMPEPARRYITIKAARRFQNRVLCDEAVYAFTKEDEAEARVALKQDEIETGEFNFLKDNTTFMGTMTR